MGESEIYSPPNKDIKLSLLVEIAKSNQKGIDSILNLGVIQDYNYLVKSIDFNFPIIVESTPPFSEEPILMEGTIFSPSSNMEFSPLGLSAILNDTITLNKLLVKGAKPDFSGYLAVALCLESGNPEALDILINSKTKQEHRLNNGLNICLRQPFSVSTIILGGILNPDFEELPEYSEEEIENQKSKSIENRIQCAKKLLGLGFDINLSNSKGQSPIESLFDFAIEKELLEDNENYYREALSFLVENGANIQLNDFDTKYLEFYCITGAEELIIDIVSANPELINKEFLSGNLPINTLIESKHFDLADKLIEMGADVNQKDKFGSTSIHYVSAKANNDLFKLILAKTENPNLVNNENKSALNYAVEYGIYNNVIKLLGTSGDINTNNNKYLIRDLVKNVYEYPQREWSKDDIRIIKLLNNSGYKISEKGSKYAHSSLEIVSRRELNKQSEKKALSQLLKFEWDSLSLYKSFKAAYKKIELNFSKEFFTSGLSYGSSILILSEPNASESYKQYNNLVDYIFSNEINVNVQDERGYTPLMNAILWDNDYLVEKILETNSADLKIDASGSTAFTTAFYKNKYDLAIKLLSSEGSQLQSGLERLEKIRGFSEDTLILKQILVSQLLKEKIMNIRESDGWVVGNDGLRYRKSLLMYRNQTIDKPNDLIVNWDVTNRELCLCNIIQGETPWFPHKGERSGGRGDKDNDEPPCPFFIYNQVSKDKIDRIKIEAGSFSYVKFPHRTEITYFDHIVDINLKINKEIYNNLYPTFFPSIKIENNYSNNLIEIYQSGERVDVLESFEQNHYDRSLGDINVVIKGKYRGTLNYDFEVQYDIGASLPILKANFDNRLNIYFELYNIKKRLADVEFAESHPLEWKILATRQHLLSELAVEAKYKEFAEQDLKNVVSELKITERWFKLIWDIINEVIDINNIDASSLKTAIALAQADASITDDDLSLLSRLEDVSNDPEPDKDEILRLLDKIKSSDLVSDINFKIFKLQVFILELAQYSTLEELSNILNSPECFQNYKPGQKLDKRGSVIIKPEDLEGKGSVILNSIH